MFSTRPFPTEQDLLDSYGDDELAVVFIKYKGAPVFGSETSVNQGDLEEQWENMKFIIIFESEAWTYETFEHWWEPILDSLTKSKRFARLLYFVRIRKGVPLATACCERGFSTMGFVNTEERSRMRTDLLALRMFVYLNAPSVSDRNALQTLGLETLVVGQVETSQASEI